LTQKDGLPLPNIPKIGQKYYDEIVIEQEPCILPVYLFKIRTDNLPKMLLEHAKEQEMLMVEAKEKVKDSRTFNISTDIKESRTFSIDGKDSRTFNISTDVKDSRTFNISTDVKESRTFNISSDGREKESRLIEKQLVDTGTVEDKTDTKRDPKRTVDEKKSDTKKRTTSNVSESVDTNYHLLDDKVESSSSSDESKEELVEM